MSFTQHKVGDKVTIKSLEWYKSHCDKDGDILIRYGIGEDDSETFVEEMADYCGQEVTIALITETGYLLEEYEGFLPYNWHDEFFEGGTDDNIVTKEAEYGA